MSDHHDRPPRGERHPEHTSKDSHNVAPNVVVNNVVEATLPPDFIDEYKRSNDNQETREKALATRDEKRFKFEIAMFVVVAIYAGLTAIQACLTKQAVTAAQDANRLNRDNFHVENAPYISIVGIQTTSAFDHSELYAYNIKNVGRTPAFNMHAFVQFDSQDLRSLDLPEFIWDESRETLHKFCDVAVMD